MSGMANGITGIRILCGLSLLFCAPLSKWFWFLYLLGGDSDVLDGYVARRMATETEFGARLDTAADMVFFGAVLISMMKAVHFPPWLTGWIVVIAVIRCANVISGLIRCKRFVTAHTAMNRLCGVLLFIVPLCMNSPYWQPAAALTCAAATLAAIQEGRCIRSEKRG